jgi:hypothetical protein
MNGTVRVQISNVHDAYAFNLSYEVRTEVASECSSTTVALTNKYTIASSKSLVP